MIFQKVDTNVKAKSVKDWKKGETYYGYYLGGRSVKTGNWDSNVYHFRNADEDGNLLPGDSHFWSTYALDSALAMVPHESLVEISYGGKEKSSGGNDFHKFIVQYDQDRKMSSAKQPAVTDIDDDDVIDWGED